MALHRLDLGLGNWLELGAAVLIRSRLHCSFYNRYIYIVVITCYNMTYNKEDRQDDMSQEQIEDAIDEAEYKYGDIIKGELI